MHKVSDMGRSLVRQHKTEMQWFFSRKWARLCICSCRCRYAAVHSLGSRWNFLGGLEQPQLPSIVGPKFSFYVADSQSIPWSVHHTCTAIPLLEYWHLTTPLCLDMCLSMSLWCMHTQSLHGRWYTTPFYFSSGTRFFTTTRDCLSVFNDLNTG